VFKNTSVIAVAAVLVFAHAASAQNFSFDARRIGMGSPGGGQNLGSKMIQEENKYIAIPLPFGLIQVFQSLDVLNPSNDKFNLVRAIELMSSPIHYTFGRSSDTAGGRDFVVDVRNGDLSRDLNDYKGVIPVNQPASEGLYADTWGYTIKLRRGAGGAFQGIFVGGGPYVAVRTEPSIDPRLTAILTPGERVYVPSTALTAQDETQVEAAGAFTGGYRARIALPALSNDRDGIYVALNFNYLRGFRYEDMDARLRMDTDRNGLLTVNPLLLPPLFVSRTNSSTGRGVAVDFGVGAVVSNWEFGFGANGIGNHIDWTDVERTTYFQTALISAGGSDLLTGTTIPVADVRVELPVDYKANVGYDVERWAAVVEFGHGFNGKSFHSGAEYRFGRFDVRGGGAYAREMWNPSGGVGLNMSPRVSLDAAIYSNAANVERKRHPALALSIRLNR
jgi:hypothetical protein